MLNRLLLRLLLFSIYLRSVDNDLRRVCTLSLLSNYLLNASLLLRLLLLSRLLLVVLMVLLIGEVGERLSDIVAHFPLVDTEH